MRLHTVGGIARRRVAARRSRAEDTARLLGKIDVDEVGDFARQSLRWLVITSVVGRIAVTVPAAILNRSVLGEIGDRVLLLSAAVIVVDAVLIIAAVQRPGLLFARWLFVADMVLAVVVTVGATLLIPKGTFLMPGPDAMTGYGWGTVTLWTAVRGWRTGLCLVGATAVLQVAMARANEAVFDVAGLANLLQRVGFALLGFLVTAATVALAYRGARLAVSAGLREGRLAGRAATLRSLHDTTLADLDAVVLITCRDGQSANERIDSIMRQALQHARATTSCVDGILDRRSPMVMRLSQVVADFRVRGLKVHVVGENDAMTLIDRADVIDALVGAVREVLNNVVKHADVRAATLRVESYVDGVQIEIVDEGCGFRLDDASDGLGLPNSIAAPIHSVGGSVGITSAPSAGTRVRLTVPTHAAPISRPTDESALADISVAWFPLIPLMARILTLPTMASKLAAIVPGHINAMVLVLGVANIGLLAALLSPGAARRLRSPLLLTSDLMVAGCFYLAIAVIAPPGMMFTPDGDGAWLYILCTVPFWLAARGRTLGAVVLCGSLALEVAAIWVNGIIPDAGNWATVLLHGVQVGAAAAYAGLVMRMAWKGSARVHDESMRAGRQAERVQELASLRRRALGAWQKIAALSEEHDPARRLDDVRAIAVPVAAELRETLQAERRRGDGGNGVADQLDSLVQEARRLGLWVEFVVTELTGDPPQRVIAVLTAATRLRLLNATGRGNQSAILLRVTGTSQWLEVSIRDTGGTARTFDEADRAIMLIGGNIQVLPIGSGGTRTTLLWSAP